MEGVPKYKLKAADLLRRPLADKFLYRALVRVNAYKCAKFQLHSSISYWDTEGSQNKNWFTRSDRKSRAAEMNKSAIIDHVAKDNHVLKPECEH